MAKILADSLNGATGDRITTFLITIPKWLQAELRTHRNTGQSHYSSRAIPTNKLFKQVTDNPLIPLWREYQKGMSGSDTLNDEEKEKIEKIWDSAAKAMIWHVKELIKLRVAKEQRNRLLEPFVVGDCIVSANDYAWEHFFDLRCAEGVQPEFRNIALEMKKIYYCNKPERLKVGEWHIAFDEKELNLISDRLKVSAARCARTSYLNHQGKIDYSKDFKLHDRLISDKHSTPFEHQFKAMPESNMYAQYKGFKSYRFHIEKNESIFD